MSTEEKVEISYKVICEKLKQDDIAKEYRVTKACICNIIRKSRKNKNFAKELIVQKDEILEKRQFVANYVLGLSKQGCFIDSVDFV